MLKIQASGKIYYTINKFWNVTKTFIKSTFIVLKCFSNKCIYFYCFVIKDSAQRGGGNKHLMINF